jgi:RND family efflux transporter MFP subunit
MITDETNAATADATTTLDVPSGATAQGAGRPPQGHSHLAFLGLAAALVVLGVGIYTGIRARVAANATLTYATTQGNTQAFTSAPIYARTNGYLKRWYVDIGAHVKKGQLLAEIDAPEIDQELQQARADLKTAQAQLELAKITADRWQILSQTNSVSKQETDQAVGNYHAMQATVDSKAANVRRLEELQSFEKISAPFDGVLTARNTDVGALINAGASAQGQGLFTLAAIDTLRVYVALPEVYARAARPGRCRVPAA